jgi:hypothetical protein
MQRRSKHTYITREEFLGNVVFCWGRPESCRIMTMNMFAVYGKVKPDTENVRGLNLVLVKLTTVQVTKLPLYHKMCKIGMICFAKPVLSEYLYVVQKE